MNIIVDITSMNKFYGALQVLKNIDLQVTRGEVVVIIGASGSGKSTLIRCVNGLEMYQTGDLMVDGYQMPPEEDRQFGGEKELVAIRKGVGMVFQQFNLFPHKTVLENITLAPIRVRKKKPAEAEATARRLLERVGLLAHAEKYPGQLSGGQQQRVAIARSLAMEPHLMLFDEPTSALDRSDVPQSESCRDQYVPPPQGLPHRTARCQAPSAPDRQQGSNGQSSTTNWRQGLCLRG